MYYFRCHRADVRHNYSGVSYGVHSNQVNITIADADAADKRRNLVVVVDNNPAPGANVYDKVEVFNAQNVLMETITAPQADIASMMIAGDVTDATAGPNRAKRRATKK